MWAGPSGHGSLVIGLIVWLSGPVSRGFEGLAFILLRMGVRLEGEVFLVVSLRVA